MNGDTKLPDADKYLQVIYLSDGNIEHASNGMTVFDLWALSNWLKMMADEMYITTQTARRIKDQIPAQGKTLEIARSLPSEN